jgi:hypothetical protein
MCEKCYERYVIQRDLAFVDEIQNDRCARRVDSALCLIRLTWLEELAEAARDRL